MANLNLQNGNKWDAASVYDATLSQGQSTLNGYAAALGALIGAGNNGKVLAVQSGALAAVDVATLIADGDEVSY